MDRLGPEWVALGQAGWPLVVEVLAVGVVETEDLSLAGLRLEGLSLEGLSQVGLN
jgi:hypothetical protein